MESASIPIPKKPTAAPRTVRREGWFEELGELAIFSYQALRLLPGSLRYFSEIIRLNAIITRRTTLLLLVMTLFLGAIAGNFSFFVLKTLGAGDFAGLVPAVVGPRQISPQMFGYVFAASVCCAISAELGSAKIQQEIAAYESEGVDPMQLLVGTRIIAVLLFVPFASMVSIIGILGGAFLSVVVILQGNTAHQFLEQFFALTPTVSILYCTITVAIVTLQSVLVACFYGLRTTGGPEAVGTAVSRSLSLNLILLHVTIALAALVFYGGGLGLPIGD
jgi:phospholipid/cholesterol/gamma-HCH transport system permease protein